MVVPAVRPVTRPALLMVATVALLLLHTPPVAVVNILMVPPAHTLPGPVTVPANGAGLTATAWVSIDVPQILETV